MKEDYESSCRQLEEAIETLEREVSSLVKESRLHSPWIERLKDTGTVSELDRGLLAMTVEEIIVMDSEHIEIHFQYRDEFAKEGGVYGKKKQKEFADRKHTVSVRDSLFYGSLRAAFHGR